ncbi:hypothetical protein ANCCAN_25468 [Ancylostoma caninum]|uniref:Ras family protein n=1 Tax=Ancylostoma caninum TaxID=29170 RepID=A0A368FDA0_ANCCA|nr:hypothetical protein ANCCAN_25468 [Ancylostoma caninum]
MPIESGRMRKGRWEAIDALLFFHKPPQIVLVGNKVDEERLRKVQVDAHCAFAKQHDLKAFYVSAKTGDSVTMMFR